MTRVCRPSLVTRDPETGLRRGPVRWPDGTPPAPFGCRWCGHQPNAHGGYGAHRWERPTRAQILARMRARALARRAAPFIASFERGAGLVGPRERRRRRRTAQTA
ncbi:hypothetical protein [Streptomyces misionensis]|uniref:hypothetical protein n=1 Tax=Streptomyces misionensis TaxID=67331 RepID=UPI0033B9ADBE